MYFSDHLPQENEKYRHLSKIQAMILQNFREYMRKRQFNDDDDNEDDSRNFNGDAKDDPEYRLVRILMKLPTLRALNNKKDLEDLFFSNLIGQVQIENVLAYILNSNDGANLFAKLVRNFTNSNVSITLNYLERMLK